MNSNNVRQISDEEIKKELTKEQLQQTQVLNFQEVQRTIRFEKITSKKPAIIVAVMGIISLLFGGTLQVANTLNSKKETVQKREIKQVVEKKLNTIKNTVDNPDGTNTIYSINYKFENDKLVGFTKLYTITAAAGKEAGKKSIENYIKEFDSLLNETEGYSIEITSNSNTSITVKVIVDYKKLDLTRLNEIQKTKPFTKVDYNKNTSYEIIKNNSEEDGFTIE